MKICPVCKKQFNDNLSFCPTDSEVLQEDYESIVGQVLDGQYEIEAFIAAGGMGAVYRARHTMLGDKVAIKILPPELRRSPEWLKRFQREGQAARRFRHPNAVAVHDLRMSGEGIIYLVMEYIEGKTLDVILSAHGGRLLPTASISIIEQVAEVLDSAHAVGVIHRDMKPSNIMISSETGQVKLLDLGIAKIVDMDGDGVLTMVGQLLGTPPFMSPEQWGEVQRDGKQDIDGRTDVYSLGVMVHQMTSGQLPFKGANLVEFRKLHCTAPPPDLSSLVQHLPIGWANAVFRAMAKDRADRYATAGEFALNLREAIGKSSVLPIEIVARESTETNVLTPPMTEGAPVKPKEIKPVQVNPNAAKVSHATASITQEDAKEISEEELKASSVSAADAEKQAQSGIAKNSSPLIAGQRQEAEIQKGQAKAAVDSGGTGDKRSAFNLLFLTIGAVLLLAGFIGAGLLIYNLKRPTSNLNAPTAQTVNDQIETPTLAPVTSETLFMRYHLLVGPESAENPKWLAGDEPVGLGQSAQFVFWTTESGYVYLFGKDRDGKIKAYPLGGVSAGIAISESRSLTAPIGSKIKLGMQEGETIYTLVFSQDRLEMPFAKETLALDGAPRKLTGNEQNRLEELRQKSPQANIKYTDDKEIREALVSLSDKREPTPIVFDIKLQLKK